MAPNDFLLLIVFLHTGIILFFFASHDKNKYFNKKKKIFCQISTKFRNIFIIVLYGFERFAFIMFIGLKNCV